MQIDRALRLGLLSLIGSWSMASVTLLRAKDNLLSHEPDVSIDLPAVQKLNGKVDYEGGWMDSDEGHNFSGSVSLPVAERFGLQGDAMYSRVIAGSDASDFYAGGAHFFWRNPNHALIGLFAGGESGEVQYSLHAGLEAEYYLPQFTFGLSAGVGHLKYDQPVSFFATDQTRFVGSAFAAWYPIDQLMIEVGYANLFENHLGQAVVEFQTPLRGLSLTADAGIGSHGYDYLLFGIRYYFGTDKRLINRHREDDPQGLLRRVINSLGLVGADFNQRIADQGVNGSGSFGSRLIEVNRTITQTGGNGNFPPLPPDPYTPPVDIGNGDLSGIEVNRLIQMGGEGRGPVPLLPPLPPFIIQSSR
ncbi:hypothetical protein GC207_06200 [bacterium]|nr:hypothetical protein [bacterium]